MARLYHVLVSMIYGHDTGVASSPGRDGANNLYLYFYIMISLCIYISIQLIGTLCVDSTDPFSMKKIRRRGLSSSKRDGKRRADAPATQMPVDEGHDIS